MRTVAFIFGAACIFLNCSDRLSLKKDIIKSVRADSISVQASSVSTIKNALVKSSKKRFRPISKKKYKTIEMYLIEAEKLKAIQNLPILKCGSTGFGKKPIDKLQIQDTLCLRAGASLSMEQDWNTTRHWIKILEASLNKTILIANQRTTLDSIGLINQIHQQCRSDSIKVSENRETRIMEQRAKVSPKRTNVLLSFPRAYRKVLDD